MDDHDPGGDPAPGKFAPRHPQLDAPAAKKLVGSYQFGVQKHSTLQDDNRIKKYSEL
jgi:hypothetical protein